MFSSVHHIKLSKIIATDMIQKELNTSKIQEEFRNVSIYMINLQDQIPFLGKAIIHLDI